MATASPAGSGGGSRRRVLLFPVPFQGHLTPMLQLAGALHARGGGGLGVTVFHAAFNAPDPARHPAGFRFVPVGEGVPSADLVPSGSDADFAGALLRIAIPVALVIGTIGAVSVVKAVYVEKRSLKCACVGGNSNVPLGFVSLLENVLMVAMAVWMLVRM